MGEGGRLARRHDIDFIRVVVFGLLMIYHTSLIFGTRGWLVHSDIPVRAFDLIALVSHPWRLSLLFFIAGITTSALSRRFSPEEIRNQRTKQLIPPLLFGIFVLIPPQIYIALTTDFGLDMGYLDFWGLYLRFGEVRDGAGGWIALVSMQHLWFLAYLWVYTAVFTILMASFRGRFTWLSRTVRAVLGRGLLLWPIVYLAILRLVLYPVFGEAVDITNDWYNHIVYFSFFALGFRMANDEALWDAVVARRYLAAWCAALSLAVLVSLFFLYPPNQRGLEIVLLLRVIRSVFQWCAIVAILGFCRLFVTRANPVITYLNRAMLSYYVMHQTVLLLVAYWLKQAFGFGASSFAVIVVMTMLVCAVLYEMQSRSFRFAGLVRRRLMEGGAQPSAP